MRRFHSGSSDEKQDVEETLARMPPRQPAVLPLHLPRKMTRPTHYYPPTARLRRGPERSRDDAIMGLGKIPVLKPQQALHASTDDDDDDDDASEGAPEQSTAGRDDEDQTAQEAATFFGQDEQSPPPPPDSTTTTPPRRTLPATFNLRLPYRLAPKERLAGTHFASSEEDEEEEKEQEQGQVAASPVPPKHQPSILSLGQGKTATCEDAVEGSSSQDRPLVSTDGVTDMEEPDIDDQVQGDWDLASEYTFRDYMHLPQTEPRRRLRRCSPLPLVRTNSDSLLPPPHQGPPHRERPISTSISAAGPPVSQLDPPVNVGRRLDFSDHPPRRRPVSYIDRTSYALHDPTFATAGASCRSSRRVSSGASSGSLPYSFYELPDSRHCSSDQSQEQIFHAQYDGAVAPRQVSRGAYHSIRLPHSRHPSEILLRPIASQPSSHVSPKMTGVGQRGASPLPANPYTSPNATRSLPVPPLDLISSSDFVDNDQDATSAATRDLSSPLDLLEERAKSYLMRIREAQNPRDRHFQPSPSRHPGVGLYIPRNHQGFQDASDLRYQYTHSSPNQATASHRRSTGPGFANNFSGHLPDTERFPQSHRRAHLNTRTDQRSSENVPAAPIIHERGSGRNLQVDSQFENFGQLQQYPIQAMGIQRSSRPISPIPVRYRLAQSVSPQGGFDRQRLQAPSHNLGARTSSRSPARGPINNPLPSIPNHRHVAQGGATAWTRAPPIPPRIGSQRRGSGARSNPARYHGRPTGPPPSIRPHPAHRAIRNPSGTNNLSNTQPPTIRQGAWRHRLSQQQQNQENSGHAEAAMMRREMAAGGMRYSQNQQLEVMDETPPRLGRLEQQIAE